MRRSTFLSFLVAAVLFDPGESQRHAGRVLRARLNVVAGDFNDQRRFHEHRVAVFSSRALLQYYRLPAPHLVRQPPERFAEHDELPARCVPGAQMQIAEQSASPPVAPYGGQHHEVQRMHGFDLQPVAASISRPVGCRRGLGHDTFVSGGECLGEKCPGFFPVAGHQLR